MISLNKAKTMINETFSNIAYPMRAVGWGRYFDNLYDLEVKEERDHRRFMDCNFSISVNLAAKLFACKHVLEPYVEKSEKGEIYSSPSDVLHMRLSYIMGKGIADEHFDVIQKAVTLDDAKEFLSLLDYSDLVGRNRE